MAFHGLLCLMGIRKPGRGFCDWLGMWGGVEFRRPSSENPLPCTRRRTLIYVRGEPLNSHFSDEEERPIIWFTGRISGTIQWRSLGFTESLGVLYHQLNCFRPGLASPVSLFTGSQDREYRFRIMGLCGCHGGGCGGRHPRPWWGYFNLFINNTFKFPWRRKYSYARRRTGHWADHLTVF